MSRILIAKQRAIKSWYITHGETYPYEWCVYRNEVPFRRFVHLPDALDYLEEIIREDTQ